jgi:crotonobetainyl-CoA:carnitine CoA-transferase CaiB-like acyl-CoA transferase
MAGPVSGAASGPLSGIRVLDFGRFAVGPAAGMYLGQLGAEVIKIESPTGDGSQKVLPLKGGVSIVYMTVNSNKKNILLDLRNPDDREVAFRLATTADVLIENFRPGVIERLGLGYADVSAKNPRIVYCAGSGYGSRGPMRELGSTDHFGQAISGFVSVNGAPGGEPELLRQAGFVDMASAQRLLHAILAGLYVRERTGRGQKVETSQLAAGLGLVSTRLAEATASTETPGPMGSACPTCVPSQAFRGADDRWIYVTAETPDQWQRLCGALARPDLAADPRYARNRDRVRHRDALLAELAGLFGGQPAHVWLERLLAAGVPCALHWTDDTHAPLWSDPHVSTVGFREPVETPWGVVNIVLPPWRFSETPATLTRAPAPDEHAEEIRRLAAAAAPDWARGHSGASGANGAAPARAVAPAPDVADAPAADVADAPAADETGATSPPGRPLAGLRVVDISQGFAGPSCAMLLGDLGADVIKVEPPAGDYTRELGPPFLGAEHGGEARGGEGRGGDQSAVFWSLNRSKRGVVLDPAQAKDREALAALVRSSDVLVSDLLPDEARRRGLDDATLRADAPRLIICSVTPFGEAGPYADRPASELTIQGFAGVVRFLGKLGDPPVRLGADVVGMTTGVYAFAGILAALLHRERSGRGQKVEVSHLLSLLATECSQLARESDPDEWIGPVRAASHAPEHPYRTADTPIYLTLARTGQQDTWPQFFRDLGLDSLAEDPRFSDHRARQAHHEDLHALLERRFADLSADEVLAHVYRNGGLGVRAHTLTSVLSDPQVAAMRLLIDVEHPELGPIRQVGVPFDLLGTPASVTLPPPRLGQHTDEVLAESMARGHDRGGSAGGR